MKVSEIKKWLSQYKDDFNIDDLGIQDTQGNRLKIYSSNIQVIPWCTEDFAGLAEQIEGENWRDVYDEEEFEHALYRMINNHDAECGITWESVRYYLNECRK